MPNKIEGHPVSQHSLQAHAAEKGDAKADPSGLVVDAIHMATQMIDSQTDPNYFLLSADMANNNSMLELQAATAGAAGSIATIAYDNVNVGDDILKADMDAVQHAASGTDMQKKSNQYAADSQRITNTNDSFNTITQASQTAVANLSNTESTAMASAGAIIENLSSTTGLLTKW